MTRAADQPIENHEQIGGTPATDLALDCIAAGIRAADPAQAVRDAMELHGSTLAVDGDEYDLDAYDRIIVLGGGNAAGTAVTGIEAILGDWIDDGVVVTDNPAETERIRILPGDHPIPSERGVESTRVLLTLADDVGSTDLVIAPITGGGSALLAAPDGISLRALQATTDALLASGATIHEINAVRKHLSAIKGGQLARRLAPATTIGLLWSDVVGDDRSVIASGPLTPDDSTFADALAVLDSYDLDVPDSVEDVLQAGAAGERAETPVANDTAFERVRTSVIASNATGTAAAAAAAEQRGFTPLVLGSRFRGRATEVGKVLVGIAEAVRGAGTPVEPPAALLSGGETTVDVSGRGIGGPNQELVVSAALELDDEGIALAAVDTDGIDGNSEAAGGVVTAETVTDRRAASDALERSDTTQYLTERDASIRTGPTGTNVNDLHVVIVETSGTSV